MALRDQPYLPLYIQDFLTDEKLSECSAKSTGIYIRLMCIMHKSEHYGKILLKQKDKQTNEQIKNFALKIAKQMPYNLQDIEDGLLELLDEKVIYIEDDFLIQKRMVKDNEISEKRAISGSKGGNKTTEKNKDFAKANIKAKEQANSENENENENVIENINVNRIPYKEIVENFNSICISLSKVKEISESRKIKIKARWNELKEIKKFIDIFKKIESSSFLKGDNKQGWKASFDWIMENDKNYLKVIEGNYNPTSKPTPESTEDQATRLKKIIKERYAEPK